MHKAISIHLFLQPTFPGISCVPDLVSVTQSGGRPVWPLRGPQADGERHKHHYPKPMLLQGAGSGQDEQDVINTPQASLQGGSGMGIPEGLREAKE